jgi:DNA-binding response OmpR family regulator
MEFGAYDYLYKPYEFEELLEKIREAVSSKKK